MMIFITKLNLAYFMGHPIYINPRFEILLSFCPRVASHSYIYGYVPCVGVIN